MQYALRLAYLGTAYAGWQRQRNARTVQEVVERALAIHLGHEVRVVAAGRTDRGVHASGQVATFRDAQRLAPGGLIYGTNALLPGDVRILAAAEVPEGFHPQRSAVAKTYCYRFSTRNPLPPELAPTHLAVDPELDFVAMAQATLVLVGEHDFQAFALQGRSPGDTRRRIYAARLERVGTEGRFQITGSGFLRGMVRGLVGTLLEVGRGKRSGDDFRALLRPGSHRGAAGPTAPAHGLLLEAVHYPEELQPLW